MLNLLIASSFLIVLFALIFFGIFYSVLMWFYPQQELIFEENPDQQNQLIQQRKRWIGIFVLIALISIMTITGINSLMTV